MHSSFALSFNLRLHTKGDALPVPVQGVAAGGWGGRVQGGEQRAGRGGDENTASNGHRSMTYLQGNCSNRRTDTAHGGRSTYAYIPASRFRFIVNPISVDTLFSMTLLPGAHQSGQQLRVQLPPGVVYEGQGLKLVHFSARREHFLWDASGVSYGFSDKNGSS